MPTLNLNSKQLLEMAQNNDVSTQYWAKVMTESRPSRGFFAERFNHFQSHRYGIEIAVKAAVTVTLGIAMFLAAPATLLYGAALTLTLSSLIYSHINLNTHEIAIGKPEDSRIDNFNEAGWEEYRAKWCREAQNYGLTENQAALHVNMRRIGLGLVISFAAFAAIASGMAVPLTLSTVLFAGSLFHRNIDEPAPYMETDGLPSLTR